MRILKNIKFNTIYNMTNKVNVQINHIKIIKDWYKN